MMHMGSAFDLNLSRSFEGHLVRLSENHPLNFDLVG